MALGSMRCITMKRSFGLLTAVLILAGCAATATVTADETAIDVMPGEPVANSEPTASLDPQGGTGLSAPTPADRPLIVRDVSTHRG